MAVIVLSGSNDYERRAQLRSLREAFVTEHGDFGIENMDASEVTFGRLLENVSSLPFLASRRMILLSNAGAQKVISERIGELLDAVADTTDLVIDEPKFDKRLSLYKTLRKRADFREYEALDERNLASWLVAEAKTRGGSLRQTDASYLINLAGHDQLGLSNELEKLLTYDPAITRESIDLLIEPLPQGSVFDLLDAAFTGNRKKAMELYKDQRRQQVEPQAIMGMLAWQLHVLAVVKYNESLGAEGIAKAARLNPYVVRKTLQLTSRLSQAQVRDLLARALQLDVDLKSKNIDADDAVQHFLLTL